MVTWVKIAAAIMIGALILGTMGAMMQGKIYLNVYSRHIMGGDQDLMVSRYICSLLGAVTASAFALFKLSEPPRANAAGGICVIGAVIAFAWLFLSRNPFITNNPHHGAIADTLLVHGIPYIWAIALLWQGRKLMLTEESSLVGLTDEKNHERRSIATTK